MRLARALRVPDDPAAAVAVRAGGLDRRLDRGVDRPVLVVLRNSLDESCRLVAEDDEVANEVEEPRWDRTRPGSAPRVLAGR